MSTDAPGRSTATMRIQRLALVAIGCVALAFTACGDDAATPTGVSLGTFSIGGTPSTDRADGSPRGDAPEPSGQVHTGTVETVARDSSGTVVGFILLSEGVQLAIEIDPNIDSGSTSVTSRSIATRVTQ
jgi:hypothetical protein